jgi:hypothetical protein
MCVYVCLVAETSFVSCDIQSDLGEKLHIYGGDSIDYCEKEVT